MVQQGQVMYYTEMQNDTVGIQAQALRDAMLRRDNMSMSELARAAGVSKSTVSLILSGKRHSTTADIISKLARALGVTSDYLIGTSDRAEPTELMLGELLVELTQVARKLPNRRQRDLLLLARAYLEDGEAKRTDPKRLQDEILDLFRDYEGEVSRDQLTDLLDNLPDEDLLLPAGDTAK